MIILGIDPGTTRVGYGLIKTNGSLCHIASGILNIAQESDFGSRLISLEKGVQKLIEEYKPSAVGLERLFFAKNKKTAIAVAHARGVLLNTFSKQSIPVKELSPPEVKLAVTGNGAASKQAVEKMVGYILSLDTADLIDDAVDALAIAIAVSNRT